MYVILVLIPFKLRIGKARVIRLSTFEAICKELNCQPGDILEWTRIRWIVFDPGVPK
ncbi:helix-turn-helix domain-containing protein [Marinilabilia rubra]|uniref:HTH cro/C1-type domain-containing protein n=1 Tax=Marinilabilia rubra TaxID=2162893 RepID=A0A2U2BDW9_9BACT|nr:helix-turn-helix domain-containing protein [Marinilabilia rubra]PWE01259.1 hypothetical protein DDZ16_01885 [Marinilabilia rubra]